MAQRLLISGREKTLFILVVFVIAVSLSYAFVIEPLYKKYQDLNQEMEFKEVRLKRNNKLIREHDAINAEFNKYSEQLKIKGSDEEEMASVLSEIEKIGQSAQVYLSDVKPQPIKDRDFYRLLGVEVKFQASMETLSKFIYNLQKSPFLLRVKRLQVNSKGQSSNLLEGTIQINKISIS